MDGLNCSSKKSPARNQLEDGLDFYPYGTQYYRAPTPLPEEWEPDFKEMARIGYTHVQYRPQWRWHERVQGKYTWDDLDVLFDLADKYKLRVIVQPMLETAPDWVFTGLEGKRIGFQGIPIEPVAHGAFYVGGWLPCFDNPKVIKAAIEFTAQLTRRYRRHPALWFYDAWNEPRSRPLGQCHCRHSIASYRQWLQKRFLTIEELNRFLGKAWTSFETLLPPESGADYAEMFLWRQWAAFAVAEQVRFVADAMRRIDPERMVMAHVGGAAVIQDVICDASDDVLNAETVDRYGTSFPIPLHPKTLLDHAAPDYLSDWVRRVDPLYWCHEFYPNHGNWCRPPDPEVLNRLIWMAMAGGAAGFTFWQYRSERFANETNGYGLREINGSSNERSQVADDIAEIVKTYGSRLVGTRRAPARIALLYSRESDLISRIQAMCAEEIHHETFNTDYPYKKSLKAAHALYLAAGETVEWVIPGDDLAGVELLHITGTEMIDAKTADWLRQYVRNGGKLIVEFPFACRDENTWVSRQRPNHGLHDLLGCVESGRIVAVPDSDGTGEFVNGRPFRAGLWKINLEPQTGKVIGKWKDGAAAAIRHDYGKGVVYSIGTSWSLAVSEATDNALETIRWIMKESGLQPQAGETEQVWIRRRRGGGREIWFVFNLSDTSKKILLPARPRQIWQAGECKIDDRNLCLPPGAAWVAEMPETLSGLV